MDKYFEQYNPNPQGKETGDCVIRALCCITNKSWEDIYDTLCGLAKQMHTMPNSTDEDYMLKRMAYFNLERVRVPRTRRGEKSLTVQQFCEEHPIGCFILKLGHHEVAVKNGKYYDLYPYRNKKVYSYWRKK